MLRSKLTGRICTNALILIAVSGSVAFAQETTQPVDEKEAQPKVEKKQEKKGKKDKIEITGSRIKRIEAATSAPVATFSKESIKSSGATNLADFFRSSALLSPAGNTTGAAGTVSAGYSPVNLFGLGSGRTLILINGRRVPGVGSSGVNLENIPTSIIEKIDIQAGGASAIYGADAVSGVMNIVTKGYMEGGEVNVYKSFTETKGVGGEVLKFDAAYGGNIGDANIVIGAGYKQRGKLDLSKRIKSARDPYQWSRAYAPEGTYSYTEIIAGKRGDSKASDNCPIENRQVINPDSKPKDVHCAGDLNEAPNIQYNDQKDYNLAFSLDLPVNNDWNLKSFASYSTVRGSESNKSIYRITNAQTGAPLRLSPTKAKELGIKLSSDKVESVLFDGLAIDPPKLKTSYIADVYGVSNILEGTIGSWDSQFGISYYASKYTRKMENVYNTDTYYSLTKGLDPKYIPIDPNRDEDTFNSMYIDMGNKDFGSVVTSDFFLSKPMFELPGGDLSLGFGGAYSAEKYEIIGDKDGHENIQNEWKKPLYNGSLGVNGSGKRNITSVYSEVSAPVLNSLLLDLALRHDIYNDFGQASNYGFGVKYDVFKNFVLRSKISTSYRAPTLASLNSVGPQGYLTIEDEEWCKREISIGKSCEIKSPYVRILTGTYNAEDLKPEKGRNYSAGFIYQITDSTSLSTDYYYIRLKDTFSRDNLQDVVKKWYKQNGLQKLDGEIDGNLVQVDSDGIIIGIKRPTKNLGATDVRALNTGLDNKFRFEHFGISTKHSYMRMLSFRSADNKNEPMKENVGYFGLPRWRMDNSIAFSTTKHTVGLSAQSIGKTEIDPDDVQANEIDKNAHFDMYTEYDLNYIWSHPWDGQVNFGIKNLRNTNGPVHNENASLGDEISTSLYSYMGRSYFVSLGQKF